MLHEHAAALSTASPANRSRRLIKCAKESARYQSNRKTRVRYDKLAYKGRNVVERCFCRLKDFRRIATRYDKLARNFFSALCLVATLAYWL
jgi:transposase